MRWAGVQAAVAILSAALAADASAYTAAGDRLFPATILLPQIAPGDEAYMTYNTLPLAGGGIGAANRSSNLSETYIKTVTDRLAIAIEETYSKIGQVGLGNLYGWQNLDMEAKFLAVNDPGREFLLSLGLDRETGGTGAIGVGASPSGATAPRIYFGKGFGDFDIGYLRPLALVGYGGLQIADAAPRPNVVTLGISVQYSMPYLQSKVQSLDLPDWMCRLVPMTEVVFTAPAGTSYGSRSTAMIAPGLSYAGEGWEFAVEALVPATRATGTGVGVTAQLHLSFDFLFANSVVGRPLFGER